MTLQEALKTGKRIRRSSYVDDCAFFSPSTVSYGLDDILATDWEVEPPLSIWDRLNEFSLNFQKERGRAPYAIIVDPDTYDALTKEILMSGSLIYHKQSYKMHCMLATGNTPIYRITSVLSFQIMEGV